MTDFNTSTRQCAGKQITSISISHETLTLTFHDQTTLSITDGGQSCCESRYMHTDDDLQYFVGSLFYSAELRDGPTEEESYDVVECEFLIVNTSIGSFTVANYNSHNGYYGGFSIRSTVQ